MKHKLTWLLALSLVMVLCLPMLLTSVAVGETADIDAGAEIDYSSLYANREHLAVSFTSYGQSAGDAPTELEDDLGNRVSVGANAVFEDGVLLNRGEILDFSEAQGDKIAQSSYTYEFVFGYEDTVAAAAGNTRGSCFDIGVLTYKVTYTQDEVTVANAYMNESGAWIYDYGATTWTKKPMLDAEKGTVLELSQVGELNEAAQTISFITYREGKEVARVSSNSLSSSFEYNGKLSFKLGKNLNMKIYAARVYSDVLTDAERKQNHFADLAGFAKIENVSVFEKLTQTLKDELYEQFADTQLTEGSKAELKAALELSIANAYAKQGNISAEDFVSFLGYQIRLYGDAPALRALYCLEDKEVEGLTLREVGAIMTVGGDYELTDLTPENAAADENMSVQTVYTNGTYDQTQIFAHEADGEEKNCFASTYIYDGESASDQYSTEVLYRAYVKVEVDGSILTLYADMTSSLDKVSLLLVTEIFVARNPDLATLALIKNVASSSLGEISNELAEHEKTVNDAKNARLDAIANIESARSRAETLKETIKNIATEAQGASEDQKQALIAEIDTLLADYQEINALAQTAFVSQSAALSDVITAAADLDRRVALVDSQSALRDRIADLVSAAEEEKTAQNAGFTNETKNDKASALGALTVAKKVGDRMKNGDFSEVKTFKVLAIGNSFSNNAMSQLYEIAASFGYEDIVLGNLYIGGCSIEKHYNNAKNNSKAYEYKKATSTTWNTYASSSLLDGLQDEEWDVITFQQVSHYSAQKATLTDGKLDYLVNYVDTNKTNANAKFYYHATWAYATDHTHPNGTKEGFEYLNDQAEMDRLIQEAVTEGILTRDDIDGVIYAGVAVAEARKYFGDAVASDKSLYTDPDGYHLNKRGCYVIGLTWFGTLTGEDISSATDVKSSFGGSAADLAAAIAAAEVGIEQAN